MKKHKYIKPDSHAVKIVMERRLLADSTQYFQESTPTPETTNTINDGSTLGAKRQRSIWN